MKIDQIGKRYDTENAKNRTRCPMCSQPTKIKPNWIEKGMGCKVTDVEELSYDATGGYWAVKLEFKGKIFSMIDSTFYEYFSSINDISKRGGE